MGLFGWLVRPLDAQVNGPAGVQEPITIIALEELPGPDAGYVAVVMRRGGVDPHDVIVLRQDAYGLDDLDSAIRVLLFSRLRDGASPGEYDGRAFETMMLGVRSSDSPESWAQGEIQRVEATLRRLRNAPAVDVPGVGRGPAVTYTPPGLEVYRRAGIAPSHSSRIAMLFVLVEDQPYAMRGAAQIRIFDPPEGFAPIQPVIFLRADAATPQLIQAAARELTALVRQHERKSGKVERVIPAQTRSVAPAPPLSPSAPWAQNVLERLRTAEPVSLALLGLDGEFRTLAYQATARMLER